MKFSVSENRAIIDQIRSATRDGADLKKLDDFLARNPVIDINDSGQMTQANGSCVEKCTDIDVRIDGTLTTL